MSLPPSKADAAIKTSPASTMSSASCSNNTEQPQTKRQKIEKIKSNEKKAKSASSATLSKSSLPEIINSDERVDQHLSSSLSSSAHSISTPSSSNNSPISTPSSSRATSLSQLLNVQNSVSNPASTGNTESGISSSNASSSEEQSADEVDRIGVHTVPISETSGSTKAAPADEVSSSHDMREFEASLTKQCLCGVSERTLRKPFQSHYSLDVNGQKRIANLSEWPTNKLLQFLSNLQLLFDIYLKQNSKGFICARIMDVCDALIRNDHNLIDEIIVLAGYNNAYVQFLAGRVLASFLVIAKQEMDDDWLKKLVDNLFHFDRLDHTAVQKIHFSLDIIKRIVEWKDIDLHPLEDEIVEAPANAGISESTTSAFTPSSSVEVASSVHAYLHFQTQQPTLETNYFAVHFHANDDPVVDESRHTEQATHGAVSTQAQARPNLTHFTSHVEDTPNSPAQASAYRVASALDYSNSQYSVASPYANSASALMTNSCHIVTLTDSESFDTTHLKCITIKILENKWPALVKNMSTLIGSHMNITNTENCILNFLQLWENIISVKANLSIVETLPFYAQLDKFELLLNQNLSCTIYKQMLCLFNEALCYGSTLALQDMLPDETCLLAHQIVRHVKDFRILESLPRRQPENIVSLIGFKRKPIFYADGVLQSHQMSSPLSNGDVIEMDKTILQKMVLLVLKSIAVTVKEIRSDSSDSSIDSTDYEAFQDMVLIERSIRDVLRKLESFIKHTLEFHPECHFSKILIHLFDDQDDHLIEAMVCTLDVTAGISFRNNAFPDLVSMLNPVYTFLEFLKMISNSSDLLLDLLVSNETCFLLYLLRFLKYIRMNWAMFVQSCHDFGMGVSTLDEAMGVLIRLRLQISRLVSRQLYPYDISPVLRLLESCESLFEGNELS